MRTKKPKLAYNNHRQPKHIRYLAWVKLSEEVEKIDKEKKYGYTKALGEGPYIFFGDIPNMPGHCVVMNRQNKFTIGMHTDNFRELTEEET